MCGGRQTVSDYGVGDDWTSVEPCHNAITINIGDLLMRWYELSLLLPDRNCKGHLRHMLSWERDRSASECFPALLKRSKRTADVKDAS